VSVAAWVDRWVVVLAVDSAVVSAAQKNNNNYKQIFLKLQ